MKTLKYIFILMLLVSCSKEETDNYLINTYLYNELEAIEGYYPDKVDGVPANMYQNYYFENFENGANGWRETNFFNETSYYRVENGEYKLRHDVEGYVRYNILYHNRPEKPLKIYDDNFEAKIKFRYINEGSPNPINNDSQFGFIYGTYINNAIRPNYVFVDISETNTKSTLGGYNDGRNWQTLSNKKTDFLNFNEQSLQSEQNILVCRKINREIYVFLNNSLVNYYQQDKFMDGEYFGFVVSNVNVAIAEIEIKKIIKK